MKKYIIIAGVNGAGKSTLYQLYDNSEKFRRFAIYKAGEIVRLSQNVLEWFSNLCIDITC